jgi:serine beta-lactamase-like protein LACTB, mitochondrial
MTRAGGALAKKRTELWLALVVLAIAAIPGLWVYNSATAPTLHPNPQTVPATVALVPPEDWSSAVKAAQQRVRVSLSERNLPGLSVAVGIGGEVVWAEGFGFADLDRRVPLTPAHRFRIGTASTVLTSAAAGLLLDEGRLKLDDPIQTYVPEFPKKQWPVTVRHLMAHTAGVKNDGGDEGPLFGEQCERPVQALPHFADSALLFEPGTKFKFSSYGWILISAAVEAASKQPLHAFLRERVFAPSGMRDTLPESATSAVPGRVTFYFPRFAADPGYGLHDMRDLNLSCYSGAGVFLSTPSDLVRFAIAVNDGKLIRRETVQLLQAPQRLESGEETGYGLGWDLETVTLAGQPTRTAGHDGDLLGGNVASLVTFQRHGLTVAVMSNISYADTFSIAVKIAEAFVGKKR